MEPGAENILNVLITTSQDTAEDTFLQQVFKY